MDVTSQNYIDTSTYVAYGPLKGTRISHYGCGAETCIECYPWVYNCNECGDRLPYPVPNIPAATSQPGALTCPTCKEN